jgi:T-complex protein 1 subunit theta
MNVWQRSDCLLSLLQTTPTLEEMGYADAVFVDEIADTSVVIFDVGGTQSQIATIVVRGSTASYIDDIERAIDDGVNTFKGITRVSLIYSDVLT